MKPDTSAAALQHLALARERLAQVPGLDSSTGTRPIRKVGVIGGGTMGRGIAINFLNAGIPVRVVETSEAAREAILHGIREVFDASVSKGRMSAEQLAERMQLLDVSLALEAVGDCDLVVEAVFEDLALKTELCARMGQVCKPGAVIASNTSTLDLDALAQASGRPEDVVGLHFFSPAHVMRLLEIVRGAATAPAVLLTALQLAQQIGKTPVVSGVCWGFIGNRMLEPYLREADFLLLEGAIPAQIDQALESFGMAMGPCRVQDMAGVDVGAKVVLERARAGALPDDASYRAVGRRLHELGRHGQKSARGYYRHEGRRALVDPEVETITRELAAQHGIARRDDIPADEIRERLLYPLINEGARILEEGVAYRASDIDMVWASGYGFPQALGGPMFYADRIGLPLITERLAHYAARRGNAHGYWTPSDLLAQLATARGRFTDLEVRS